MLIYKIKMFRLHSLVKVICFSPRTKFGCHLFITKAFVFIDFGFKYN